MAFDGLLITEIFHSIQGETSESGLPYVFIRLTGCNLRCSYCDSSYSFKGGAKMDFQEVLKRIQPYGTKRVLLTGGEPLLQRGTLPFIKILLREGYRVSIETHGEVSIEAVSPISRIVMDIKTPESGMCRMGFKKNLPFLKPTDEIKFVIASSADYEWAREMVRSGTLPQCEILFSPAVAAKQSPGNFEGISPRDLAERVLADRLPVRLQIQLHKFLWGHDTKGV